MTTGLPAVCLVITSLYPKDRRSLTGDLSQRSRAGAVPLLCVHLPGVGAAAPRGRAGAPGPGQRAEQHQQREPGLHAHKDGGGRWNRAASSK